MLQEHQILCNLGTMATQWLGLGKGRTWHVYIVLSYMCACWECVFYRSAFMCLCCVCCVYVQV